MGRRNKWGYRQRLAVRKQLEEYVRKTAIPSVAEFAYKNSVPRTQLYRWEELEETMDLLRAKREANLEKQLLAEDSKKATGAIFALKQLGWSDRNETTHVGEVKVAMVAELPKRETIEEWQARGQVQQKKESQGQIEESSQR